MGMIEDIEDRNPVGGFERGISGVTPEWKDGELQPWSPARKVAAQSMGMLYPYIGEEGAEQLSRTGFYAGVLKDVAIFMWLCAPDAAACPTKDDPNKRGPLPKSEIQRAIRKPMEAMDKAMDWAESAGLLDITGKPFLYAVKLFTEEVGDEQDAHIEPDLPEEKGAGNSDPN